MTAIDIRTTDRALGTRRTHQHEVERLLEQIRRQMVELRRLKAAGVRAAAFSDRKRRLEQTRRQLAYLVSASTSSADIV